METNCLGHKLQILIYQKRYLCRTISFVFPFARGLNKGSNKRINHNARNPNHQLSIINRQSKLALEARHYDAPDPIALQEHENQKTGECHHHRSGHQKVFFGQATDRGDALEVS